MAMERYDGSVIFTTTDGEDMGYSLKGVSTVQIINWIKPLLMGGVARIEITLDVIEQSK
jgi:hypothetical protein